MVPQPVVLGLNLCDYVILEAETNKISLIGIFPKLRANRFPFLPSPFCVHAALTDGLGDATIDLIATRLDSGENIYARRRRVRFSSKLRELHVVFKVNNCSFPSPGTYLFTLLVDGEWVAQRRLRIYSEEQTQ